MYHRHGVPEWKLEIQSVREVASAYVLVFYLFFCISFESSGQSSRYGGWNASCSLFIRWSRDTVPLNSYEFTFRFFCRSVSCIVCCQCPTMFQMKENVTGLRLDKSCIFLLSLCNWDCPGVLSVTIKVFLMSLLWSFFMFCMKLYDTHEGWVAYKWNILKKILNNIMLFKDH